MVPSKIRLQKSVASFFHLTPHLLDLMKQGAILQVAFQRDLCVKEHLAVCVCVCRGGGYRGVGVKVKVAQLCPTLCGPMVYRVHGILQARILEWVAFLFSRGLPNPGIEPRSPALQVHSSPAQPPGKPKNTGMGTLSLLQQIFPPLESNWGLLHCRLILYQPL